MTARKEITDLHDIKTLVDTFYSKVRNDQLLGPVFEEKIGNHWSSHLQKMYAFWETLLLGNHTYSGSPFLKHAGLPIDDEHFERWLDLFSATVDEFFHGEKADEAKNRAVNMALMFQSKLAYIRQTGSRPLK